MNFVNLQYGNHENAIKNLEDKIGRKVFLNDNIDNKNDIYGLAQKIKKCDAVLTIDNSTVHLSGFLNKTTFLICCPLLRIGDGNYTEMIPLGIVVSNYSGKIKRMIGIP